MKRILWLVALLLLAPAALAQDIPEAESIKTDVVVAERDGQRRQLPGYIFRNNTQMVILRRSPTDEQEVRIPQSAIIYVFYREADNANFTEALKEYGSKNYAAALESLNSARSNSNNFATAARAEEFGQYINFYSAMSHYRLGNYEQAVASFNLCLQPRDAIFKFQAEYYLGRSYEADGKYREAETKYGQLADVVFPKLLETAAWGKKWDFLSRLGRERAKMLALSEREGQDAGIQKALEAFEALLKSGGDFVDQDVNNDALLVRASAMKYLAKKNPKDYEGVINLLSVPVREAVVNNDKSSLNWMYVMLGDCYYGLMEGESDPAKKKEWAERARFEYLRVSMVYSPAPNDLCKAYFRAGKLFEFLKDTDWQQRALQQYRFAAGSRFRAVQPMNDDAGKAAKALAEQLNEKAADS